MASLVFSVTVSIGITYLFEMYFETFESPLPVTQIHNVHLHFKTQYTRNTEYIALHTIDLRI